MGAKWEHRLSQYPSTCCQESHRARQHSVNRESTLPPRGESALKRPHARHSAPLESERHPGARRFVRSRAVQDDIPVAGDLLMSSLKLLGRDSKRPWDHKGNGGDVQL